jgi:dolichol-phosphate mannosyltransferase
VGVQTGWDVSDPLYSLVVPFHNEAENAGPVLDRALRVLDGLGQPFEIVAVDDGSTDATPGLLNALAAREGRVRVVSFPHNRGQDRALWVGLTQARGEWILTMDGDGQNPPEELPGLLRAAADEGADLVCGWRRDRNDSGPRRLMSRLANLVRSRFLGDGLHDGGCQLRVMRRSVLGALREQEMLQAFVPAMAAAAGFTVAERVVVHAPRTAGQAHYSLANMWWRPLRAMVRVKPWLTELKRRRAGR